MNLWEFQFDFNSLFLVYFLFPVHLWSAALLGSAHVTDSQRCRIPPFILKSSCVIWLRSQSFWAICLNLSTHAYIGIHCFCQQWNCASSIGGYACPCRNEASLTDEVMLWVISCSLFFLLTFLFPLFWQRLIFVQFVQLCSRAVSVIFPCATIQMSSTRI